MIWEGFELFSSDISPHRKSARVDVVWLSDYKIKKKKHLKEINVSASRHLFLMFSYLDETLELVFDI